MENKFYPRDTSFHKLDCDVAFKTLTKREKLYAHYLSRAAWQGQFITMFQTSAESPLIFILLDKIFRFKSTLEELKAYLLEKHSFSEADVEALFLYASAFLSNCGNYRGFGDSKFIPELDIEKMKSLTLEVIASEEVAFFMDHCVKPMFDYSETVRFLNFPPNGTTTYWSANCTEEDGNVVTAFMNYKQIEAWNCRVFKTRNDAGKDVYEIRFASKMSTKELDYTMENLMGCEEEYQGKVFRFTRGDYSEIISSLICDLKLASQNALNYAERSMLRDFVEYFKTGSVAAHKNGSRQWIRDKGPTVETYIGFIEAYRDPVKSRAEFEGFVAVVNKKMSEKLGELVNHAEAIITTSMPWPKEFEIDSYLKPDFTALDVITFCSSMVPSGINIPNYDEIRRNEGFKNVQLLNSVNAFHAAAKIRYLGDADAALLQKYRERAYEVQVGLHELLGHGSGKLFCVNEKGEANFDRKMVNPLSNQPISTFYRPGETFKSRFTATSSAYEECRAECVGLYLCCREDVLKIFKCDEQEAEDVMYINWLMLILAGMTGLQAYDPNTKKWGQAHSQARFVILQVLLEGAKDLVDIKIQANKDDGKPDLLVSLNRADIKENGRKAIGDFLTKLQVYKSTADVKSGCEMFTNYSQVSSTSPSGLDFEKIRTIVIDRKTARPILVQSNTRLSQVDFEVELITYENSSEGFVKSWLDRHPEPLPIYEMLKKLYLKDLQHFSVK